MNKKLVMFLMAVSVLTGCTATPTFAQVDAGTEGYWEETTDYGYEETTWEDPGYVEDTGYVAVEGEIPDAGAAETATEATSADGTGMADAQAADPNSTAAAVPVEENNPPLTPEGNMSLVDDVTTSAGTKEFLTLTSRAGNFYYLIIDRDKDGNQNVHFLNQVDERDLISIMDEDEAKELEESITQKAEAKKAEEEAKAAEEAAKAAAEAEAQNPPEPTPAPEKTVTIGGYEYSQKIVGGIIAGVAAIIIALIAFFALGKKQKAEQNKPDPDADYDDEYGDEIDIPEGEPEDEDYEE